MGTPLADRDEIFGQTILSTFVLLTDNVTKDWAKASLPKQKPCDRLWGDRDDDDVVDTSAWRFPSRQSRGLERKSFHYSAWVGPQLFYRYGRVVFQFSTIVSKMVMSSSMLEYCSAMFAQQCRTDKKQTNQNLPQTFVLEEMIYQR